MSPNASEGAHNKRGVMQDMSLSFPAPLLRGIWNKPLHPEGDSRGKEKYVHVINVIGTALTMTSVAVSRSRLRLAAMALSRMAGCHLKLLQGRPLSDKKHLPYSLLTNRQGPTWIFMKTVRVQVCGPCVEVEGLRRPV